MLGGFALIATAAFNMTVGEQLAADNQQKAAEVVPLVDSQIDETATSGATSLEVGQVFARLRVPRFGEDYVRNIAEGTSLEKVLNTVGIGHYRSTQMPGEVGNFALAGHRSGNGGPFRNIDKLQAGDLAVVETATTRYIYRFIEQKIVEPSELGVIAADPVGLTQKVTDGKYLTMTSCTPIYVNTQRIIAWFTLISESAL